MKLNFKIVGLLALLLISCRERNNMFDTGSSSFIPPPAIFDARATMAYYNSQGYLIGIKFEINFVAEFEKVTILHNTLYELTDSSRIEMVSFDVTMKQGDLYYTEDVYAGYDVGLYYLTIYFGGIPIGAATFAIVAEDNSLVIKQLE